MGIAAALLVRRDPYALFIDDVKEVSPLLKGYARPMFKKMEWPTLKIFCNTYGIKHGDTCVLFKRFLQYEEVYLLEFKVRTKDVKDHFAFHSKLEKEIVDAVVPLMFMKEFPGLEPASANGDVVSFARFIITAYLFCAATVPDLIHDFIAMLRQKLTMSVHTKLHAYSLEQLMKVLVEDLQPSAASWILSDSLGRINKDEELSVATIVKMGMKYPVLFYLVDRFRKHVKRLVFGDRFWAGRPSLKCRLSELEESAAFYAERYKDERTALMETSRSIIADVVAPLKPAKRYILSENYVPNVLYLDDEALRRLKDIFGYERSRQLVIDSEIVFDCEAKFVECAFGASSPVPRPARGMSVFPEGQPCGILEMAIEQGDGQDSEGDRSQQSDHEEEGASNDGSEEKDPVTSVPDEGADGAPQEEADPASPSPQGRTHELVVNNFRDNKAEDAAKARIPHSPTLKSAPILSSAIETILDPQLGREFRFDPETGRSAWVYSVVDFDGDVVLERCP